MHTLPHTPLRRSPGTGPGPTAAVPPRSFHPQAGGTTQPFLLLLVGLLLFGGGFAAGTFYARAKAAEDCLTRLSEVRQAVPVGETRGVVTPGDAPGEATTVVADETEGETGGESSGEPAGVAEAGAAPSSTGEEAPSQAVISASEPSDLSEIEETQAPVQAVEAEQTSEQATTEHGPAPEQDVAETEQAASPAEPAPGAALVLEEEQPEASVAPAASPEPEPEPEFAPAPEPEPEPKRYTVQLGGFHIKENADALLNLLTEKGYPARLFTAKDSKGKVWHTVRLNVHETADQAARTADDFILAENRDAVVVVEGSLASAHGLQKETVFSLQAGVFLEEREAKDLQIRLAARGYQPCILRAERSGRPLFIVELAEYVSEREAEAAGQEVARNEGLAYYVQSMGAEELERIRFCPPR